MLTGMFQLGLRESESDSKKTKRLASEKSEKGHCLVYGAGFYPNDTQIGQNAKEARHKLSKNDDRMIKQRVCSKI